MKQKREEWPATPGAKVAVVVSWAFLGILLGCFAYALLWLFMVPNGLGIAVVNLITSPWAWGFLALCAFSMALVPAMAICRGNETSYGRLLYFLLLVWALGLLITEIIAILVYRLALRGHHLDWSVVHLFTLCVPTALALVVLIAGSCRDER